MEWDWTLTGQGREEGEARQIDQYKDANYFYQVYEQDVYKWWTYNVIETTYDYNPNDPDWQEWILMGKFGRVTDNSDHTFEEYSIEGFEVQITPEEMALINKGVIDSYGPPPGERRMLYSIKLLYSKMHHTVLEYYHLMRLDKQHPFSGMKIL